MLKTARIARRFCGPPESGNGGYSSGLLAQLISGACECTLRKPIPLEHELICEASASGARMLNGEELVIEAAPTAIEIANGSVTGFEEALRASEHSPAFTNHPFPTCFTCGPLRAVGDGLRIFPGRVSSDDASLHVFASPWIPDASLSDPNRQVRPEFVWAAMDCPTGFAAGFPWMGALVTGRLALDQVLPVRTGERHVIMSWSTGVDGRKHHAGAALYGPEGQLCAKARATWIRLS